MPARSLKNFQCAILIQNMASFIQPSAASHLLSTSFTQKAYELGKQYYDALDSNKITMMDLTLNMPSEFRLDTMAIMTRDPQEATAFKLGRISVRAATDLLYKAGAVNDEGDIDPSKLKQKSPELLEEYCDFKELNMPAPMLERMQQDLKSTIQD